MKKDDDPDYWTRVFNATSKGSSVSFAYLRNKYLKDTQNKSK